LEGEQIMPQLTYSYDMVVGVEGELADARQSTIVSRLAEGNVRFGRFVALGSNPDTQCRVVQTGTDVWGAKNHIGFSVATNAKEQKADGTVQYDDGEAVSIIKNGAILIKSETAMTPTSDVFIRFQAKSQVYTLVFDATTVTGNEINGEINGVAINPVTFATSNANTLSLLATEIANFSADILSAVSNGTDTITITSVIDKSVTVSNFVVTGGASQPTITATQTEAGKPTSDVGIIRNTSDGGTAQDSPYLRVIRGCNAGELATVEIEF